jgi:Zn-dependent protease with chaperone function
MAGLLPLLIALTIIETAVHHGRAEATGAWTMARALSVIAAGLALWLTICELGGRILTRQPALSRRWLERWDILLQGASLIGFAGLCYGGGWATRADYYSLALAPWVVAQATHWWCLAPVVRTATSVPWSRNALLWHQVRFSLLPFAVALPVLDLCTWIARSTPLEHWLFATFGEVVNVAGGFILAAALVTLLPWLLVRMWGAQPLTDPGLYQELSGACARAGVQIGAILRWPVRGGRVYNAMVLGVLPRLRYVLFTDDLLRDFTPAERVAVLGHELGHARHHHLWLYLLFALTSGLISWAARAPLDAWVATLPFATQLETDVRAGLVALVLLALQWRLLFGVLSRMCERQADLAGAELAGGGDLAAGSAIMRQALLSVARLAGIDPRSPSWRHYSIAERVAWLERAGTEPTAATQHHQRVAQVARILAAAAGILLALAWINRP